jgi:hypothetical protein
MMFKGETVYSIGRQFNVTNINQPNGLVRQNNIDYALRFDFSLPADTRLNLQFFQRVATNHDPDTLADKYGSGVSVRIDGKLDNKVGARALVARSLNRSDRIFRPKVTWVFEKNWRLEVGVDIFSGRR